MSLTSPNLDDRRFGDLMSETLARIKATCPEWTDLTPSDPGIALLESFAYLTEILLYRVNRIPEKATVEFLKLMGVSLYPPSAAGVVLTFSLNAPRDTETVIPSRTKVTIARGAGSGEPPEFMTLRNAVIPPGKTSVSVHAFHAEAVDGELAGTGTGQPGFSVRLSKAPAVVTSFGDLDFIVGVETLPEELEERTPAIRFNDKTYRIWSEVSGTSEKQDDPFIYTVDRAAGLVQFGQALNRLDSDSLSGYRRVLTGAAVPEGREVRVWYYTGGGPSGNLAPHTLTVLKTPVPSVKVTNETAATGGRNMEKLDNAMLRGPKELHSLERAVTACDFELIARKSSGAVSRAKAFTKASLWTHALPGTVDVLLVPDVAEEETGGSTVTATLLKTRETPEILEQIKNELDTRKPLGTTCLVNWVRYKTVSVRARVVVHREQNPEEVKERVEKRLYATVTPLPGPGGTGGWAFGKPLRISDIYDIILKEPGVNYADNVSFSVDEVPDCDVRSISVDGFQKKTWYATEESALFRSMNDGEGWETVLVLEGETVESVAVSRYTPGVLAVHTKKPGSTTSSIHISMDSGETWSPAAETAFEIEGMAFSRREGLPLLFLATDVGLYELWLTPGATPVQVLVNQDEPDMGFYSVATSMDNLGTTYVIAASQGEKGLYMSSQGGKTGTFSMIGFKDTDIRVLAIQTDGPRSFLWAGETAMGNEEGQGCHTIELRGSQISPEGWTHLKENWSGGSCKAIAFYGSTVLAATHRGGILSITGDGGNRIWKRPNIKCGLPIRDTDRLFQPVHTLSVNPDQTLVLAGTPEGVFKSGGGEIFAPCSKKEFTDKVTLPETWLFCSGRHDITVETDDEPRRH
jgi:hypothetical protein